MEKKTWLLRALLITIVMACRPAFCQMPIHTVDTPNYKVSLLAANGQPPAFTFDVFDKRSATETSVSVQNRTTELRSFTVASGQLVLFGSVSNAADIATVQPLSNVGRSTYFLCYGPQISSTGKYIAYKRFYPRFADAPSTSDVLILYDLDISNNQKLIEPGNLTWTLGDPAGRIVFPKENAESQSLGVWIEKPEMRHAIASYAGYLWADKDKGLVFIDTYEEKQWLVYLDLTKGPKELQPRTVQLAVPESEIVTSMSWSPHGILLKFRSGETREVTLP